MSARTTTSGIDFAALLREVLDHFGNVDPPRGGWYKVRCCFHDDQHPSLRLNEHGFRCMASTCDRRGSLVDLARDLGLMGHSPGRQDRIERTYDYVDEEGVLLYQSVRRHSPKDFFQRRPHGRGSWINDLKGVRRVLYRLPEVLAAPYDQALFVVEGEKDVDRLWAEGLAATTNPMGAGNWRSEYAAALRGRDVIIIPDNDDAGLRHAETVVRSLGGIAVSVRTLELPGLPPKGDVSDWLDEGNTVEDLWRLANDASPAVLPVAHEPAMVPDEKPEIAITERHLNQIADDGWKALHDAPRPLFRHGRIVAEVCRDDGGRPRISHLSLAALRGKADRAASWLRFDKNGPHPVAPPKAVIEDMLALPEGLPILRGIIGTPTFAADGTLDTRPGYQPATKLFYEPSGAPLPPVPEQPDASDLRKAKLIFSELLGDFPFADDSSRAHALAVPVTAAVREMIDGPTPLFAFDAPTPGTGKTLLAGALGLIVSGAPPALTTHTRSEDEMRKRITSLVIGAAPVVLLDNVKRRLTSETLAGVLTTTTWADRILGKSEYVDLPIRTLWLVTGNNLELDTDIARRTVWIRLDAKVDMPWERNGFRIALPEWAVRHRHELVWATLVLVRHWLSNDRPAWTGALLGSFEDWSRIVGGILACADIDGFLANREQLYRRMDPDSERWRAFVRTWWEQFGEAPVRVADLYPLADEIVPSLAARNTDASEQTLRARLGWALAKRRDQSIGGLRIVKDESDAHGKVNMWRLEVAGDFVPDGDLPADSPHDNESTPDSLAGDAGSCGYALVPRAIAGDQECDQSDREGAANPHPQLPQLPAADSESTADREGDSRGSSVMTSSPPQEYRCTRCRMPMRSTRVSDVCGWCQKEEG